MCTKDLSYVQESKKGKLVLIDKKTLDEKSWLHINLLTKEFILF